MGFYKWFVFIFLVLFLSLGSVSASDDVYFGFDVNETFLDDDYVVDDSFSDLSDEDCLDEDGELSFNRSGDFGFGDLNSSGDGDAGVQANVGTVITASGLTKYFGESATLYAYLKKSNGDPLSGKTLKFKIHGVTYSRTTNSNGRAGLGINLYPGTYTCQISFSASGYTSSSKSVTVKVNTAPTTLNSQGLVKMYGEPATWYAYLYDRNNNPLSGINLAFTINGVTYNRTTNSNGRAGLEINLYPKNYTGKVSVAQKGYASSTKNVNIQVNPIPVYFEVDNLIKYYGETGYLKAYLKDSNNNPIMGKTVIFSINGRTYNNTTDAEGCAVLPITLYPKNYTANVTLNYKPYGSPTRTVDVIVKPIPVSLDISNLYFDIENQNNNYLYVYLTNMRNNEPLVNQNITFTMSGVACNVSTDSNGCARFRINQPLGTYPLNISFYKKYHTSIVKCVNVNVVNVYDVNVNVSEGFYDNDYLLVNFTALNDEYIVYCSFDNDKWYFGNGSSSFNLSTGNWSVNYYGSYHGLNTSMRHVEYIVDGSAPLLWASHESGIYESSFSVNLNCVDFFDENPVIYYTLDGSEPTINSNVYSNPILISDNSNLKCMAKDCLNHTSDVISLYYFFGYGVANINSGKFYSSITNAILDYSTLDNDIIEISNGVFNENVTINKSILLMGNNLTIINGFLDVIVDDACVYNCLINAEGGISANIDADNVSLVKCKLNCINGISCINHLGNNNGIIDCIINCVNGGYGFIINNTHNLTISGCIINSTNGNLLINSNNCEFWNNIFLKNNYTVLGCNKLFLKNCFNNSFHDNNLSCGLVLNGSGDNVFYSNWISDNLNFYLIYVDSPGLSNDFYLNYIYNGIWRDYKLQGIFVSRYSHVDVSNNWWGSRNPNINIVFSRALDVSLDGYMFIKTYVGSYKVDNGFIYGVDIVADLTSNSRGEDLSNIGFLPDGISVNFYSSIENINSTLVNGKCCQFMSMDAYNDVTTFHTDYVLDGVSISVNKSAVVSFHAVSTALYGSSSVDFTYNFELNQDVSWISLVYRSLGNYTSELNLVVNGDVVESFNVTNSRYVEFKGQGISDDVLNAVYMYNDCLYNEYSRIRSDIDVYYALTFDIFDLDQIHNSFGSGFYFPALLDPVLEYFNTSKEDILLELIGNYFNLSYDELFFVRSNHDLFQDTLMVYLSYPGDVVKDYYINDDFELNFAGSEVYAISNITYINGAYYHLDEIVFESYATFFNYTSNSIFYVDGCRKGHIVNSDYDGILTYTFVCDKIDNDCLEYWLGEKNRTDVNGSFVYEQGFMKACYGSFLNGFLTYYCLDKVADIAAVKFNVSWSRSTPICISVYDIHDYCVLSGRSDFRFGMDVFGDDDNVRAFRYTVTSMFSQIEHWVMKALFPDNGNYGSVTIGLANLFLEGNPLEFFLSDNLIVIRENSTNSRVLVIEYDSGIVRDVMVNGTHGAYCYFDQQTDWACELAEWLLVLDEWIYPFLDSFNNEFEKFLNGTCGFVDAVEHGLNSALNSTVGFLDGVDDFGLGIVGGIAISVGVGLFLVSNPIGWAALAGACLVVGGGILTYYADDLNKGWTYSRGLNFGIDIVLSSIPVLGSETYIGKVVISDTITHQISKNSINEAKDIILRNLMEYGADNIRYISYGTFWKAVYKTFGTSKMDLIKQGGYISVGQIKSWIINYLFKSFWGSVK